MCSLCRWLGSDVRIRLLWISRNASLWVEAQSSSSALGGNRLVIGGRCDPCVKPRTRAWVGTSNVFHQTCLTAQHKRLSCSQFATQTSLHTLCRLTCIFLRYWLFAPPLRCCSTSRTCRLPSSPPESRAGWARLCQNNARRKPRFSRRRRRFHAALSSAVQLR